MSAPPKPWETRIRPSVPPSTCGRYSPRLSPPGPSSGVGQDATSQATPSRQPPPPPARSTSFNGTSYGMGSMFPRYYGGFGSTGPYNSYGSYGSYGGYGGYSSYGGYRPYGSYGYGSSGTQYGRESSQFVRQAEDRTRPAFQSVESIVGAFGSIAMMLDSTYMAIHTCFRAILGVVDHFSSMRTHLWEIISTIRILRWLSNIIRRLLHLLRRNQPSANDTAWEDTMVTKEGFQDVASRSIAGRPNSGRSINVWPAITFFVTIIGIPWLLWRLISRIATVEGGEPDNGPAPWLSDVGSVKCVTLYSYSAQRNDEMSFESGQELVLAPPNLQPRIQGWALAGNNHSQGLVPQSYIQPIPPSGQRGVADTPPN